jgi:hypothetical protein
VGLESTNRWRGVIVIDPRRRTGFGGVFLIPGQPIDGSRGTRLRGNRPASLPFVSVIGVTFEFVPFFAIPALSETQEALLSIRTSAEFAPWRRFWGTERNGAGACAGRYGQKEYKQTTGGMAFSRVFTEVMPWI